MPDDSSGNYSVPAGTLVNTGDTVLPSQHNPWANDSASAISNRFSKDGRAPATGNWNLNTFRITGLGTPSASTDATNKSYVDTAITNVNSSQPNIENLAANRLALAADKGKSFRFSGNRTLTFQPAATLGANWWCEVWSKSGIVTLDPDAAETIEGASTMLVNTGERCIVFCTGTLFYAISASSSYSGPQLQGYSSGLALTTNVADAANDVDIAVGAAAADVSPYDLIQLGSAITKRIDAAWAVGNNQGGLDTGSVSNSTYYIWLIRRPDTGVVDALFSLSATAPTMPANYTQKRLIGGLTRTGGVNSAPNYLLDSVKKMRAMANFNATGTLTIRDSMNILAITDNGIGQYAPIFATPAPNTNYSVIGSATIGGAGSLAFEPFAFWNGSTHVVVPPTTAGFSCKTNVQGGTNASDGEYVMFEVIW